MTGHMSEAPITEAELQAYVDDRLDPERRSEVEAWLAARPEEAERLADYRKLGEAMRAAYAATLTEPVPQRFLRKRPRWGRYGVAAGLFATGILLGGILGWELHGARRVTVASSDLGTVMARRAAVAHVTYSPEVRHPV
ncbi:MAG TPA: anti-sigma factor, partial [Burkholderiales bacterium]|nr:anti-sigma factor [Burkholderiales bacterium]